jgi:hypothetical protein
MYNLEQYQLTKLEEGLMGSVSKFSGGEFIASCNWLNASSYALDFGL